MLAIGFAVAGDYQCMACQCDRFHNVNNAAELCGNCGHSYYGHSISSIAINNPMKPKATPLPAYLHNTKIGSAPSSNYQQQTQQNNYQPSRQQTEERSTQSREVSRSAGKQMCPMKCNKGECTGHGVGLNYCHGTGYLDCSRCSGRGTVNNGKEICSSCKGKKKVECGLCHGDGKCRRCGGTGWI